MMQKFIKQILPKRFKWTPHHIVGHGVAEIARQLGFIKLAEWLHTITLPKDE